MFEIESIAGKYHLTSQASPAVAGEHYHLHSGGQVFKNCCEWFPTRADAETILAKYPDAAPPVVEREWKHGDVFITSLVNSLMVYLIIRDKPCAFLVNIERPDGCYGPATDLDSILKGAKFLFNINDAVKERQAATDAESCDETPSGELAEIPDEDAKEFIVLVREDSHMQIGDYNVFSRIADNFEATFARIEDER